MGIVGGGFGRSFQWHLDPNCVVEAVSDLRPDRRRPSSRSTSARRPTSRSEKLVLDPKIEAVAVFTGAPDHARHVHRVHEARQARHLGGAGLPDARRSPQMKEVEGEDRPEVHDGRDQLLPRPTIFAAKLWADGKFGDFLYSEVEYYHHEGRGGESSRSVVWQRQADVAIRPPADALPDPLDGLPRGGHRGSGYGRLVPRLGARRPRVSGQRLRQPLPQPGRAVQDERRQHLPLQRLLASPRRRRAGAVDRRDAALYMHAARAASRSSSRATASPRSRRCPTIIDLLPEPMRVDTGHGNSHTFLTHEFIAALVEDREPAVDLYESLAMTVPGIVANESASKAAQLKVPSFDKA